MNFEYMWEWRLFIWILMIIIWILIFLGAVAIFKWITGFKTWSSESALEILKKRYAKGEISEEGFNKMKEKLWRGGNQDENISNFPGRFGICHKPFVFSGHDAGKR
jgi:putative membrane protein